MKPLKIALVPLQRLGDGVISLILANNLHKNHFSVTMFHGFMHQIEDWFEFQIQDYPDHEHFEALMGDFDIVLIDMCIPYVLSKSEKEQEQLSRKYIFYAVGRMQDVFTHDHTERLIQTLGDEARGAFEFIAIGCRTIKYDRSDSMVENMTHYCDKILKLKEVTNEAGILIPDELIFQKHKKRVVISPTSSLEKKNWGSKKFLALARRIQKQGYDPVFAVAMNEREEWQAIISGEFELPEFSTIKKYAEYLYESLGFIGNDSGGGHMASLMGVPVLTIVTSPRKINFKWRPGWGSNAIVAPNVTFKWQGKRHWHPFLSVKKVYNRFQQLTGKR